MKEKKEKVNQEEEILRRVKENEVSMEELQSFFSKEEEAVVHQLLAQGFLTTRWNDDALPNDFLELVLTRLGEVRLFKKEYAKEVDEFLQLLDASSYDSSLIDDFLKTQDLEKGVYEIFNLDCFTSFCSLYDRALFREGVSSLSYQRVSYQKGQGFDEEGKKLFQDLLSVWDEGHIIFIAHPNHVFQHKMLTADVRNISHVSWDSIDVQKMLSIQDYASFFLPDCQEAFSYVHRRMAHQLRPQLSKGVEDATTYLVVLEQYPFDYESNYLVRGIIKGDKDGYSIALNPEYVKAIPASVWDKSLRFSGNEVSPQYLVKRLPKADGSKK